MAATGGGKIKTRRYHIVSKPYGKSKQQTGLISRVTDTVKSIVPSWLQKYFNNDEVPEEGETRVPVEQNNVPTPSNGNQEAAPLPQGRDSPEPSTSNAEASTSRASLNFQDVFSRPPLNRTHLHFSSLDGSPALGGSLFSQPSTSTAPFPTSPFAVNSNFSLVKEIKDSSSQHEDDNISTTSGFSSRASDKDVPTSKTAPLLWSPETERTQSGTQLTHTSLKKPTFNLSVFGASSSSSMNSSVMSSSQLGDSPFYPGKTTYGGAAAAKSARLRPGTPYQAPVRRQIKAKPAGAQPCGVTSATARRILQSLERMSSPLADAKRIPSTVSSPLSISLNHSNPDVSNFQSRRRKLEPAVPPVQKLVIPAVAAVSGNRAMSFRPSLTPGSVSRPVEKVTKETPVRRSPNFPVATPAAVESTSSLSYPLSSTPAASVTGAGGGKMKRERSIRPSTKRPDDEVAEVPDLPAVSLPISNFKLPTFSFSSPPLTSAFTPSTMAVPQVSQQAAVSKVTNAAATPVSFTFSSPIVKATAASPESFSPSSGFTFSEPTMKTTTSISNGNLTPAMSALKTGSDCNEFDGPFRPAKVLKQGSVLDILKEPGFASPVQKVSETEPTITTNSTTVNNASLTSFSGFGDKFKLAAGSWNCTTCLLQNKSSDKKCVACQVPQPSTDSAPNSDRKPANPSAASLSSLFAPPAGSWECDTCMVQNKPEVVKCVACDTTKPGTGVKPALARPPVCSTPPLFSTLTTTSTTTPSGLLSFADKFKMPEGAWNCDVCMVQNKAEDVKCVSCQSPKAGTAASSPQIPSSQLPAPVLTNTTPLLGFGERFKKPDGSWECDVCCVQNKAEDKQCVACQSARPGAKVEIKGFGSQSSSTSSSTAFTFGTSSSVSSEVKFVDTFSNSTSTGSIKFGTAPTDSPASSSNVKSGSSSSDSSSEAFKFTIVSKDSTSGSAGGFKFSDSSASFKLGVPTISESTSDEKKSESQTSGAGFKFVESSAISFGSNKSTATASGGFKFELSKPEEKSGLSQSFVLSTSKINVEKNDLLPSTQAVSASANPLPVFGKPSVTESNTAELTVAGTAQNASTTSFIFGKPDEKKDTSITSGGFPFSAAKEAEKPTPSVSFTFSKPDPPKEPNTSFTFGKFSENKEATKTIGFGQNATDNAAPQQSFNFIGNSSNTPAPSSLPPNLFGTPSSISLAPTLAPSGRFAFHPSSSSETPSQTFTFGKQESQTVKAVPPTAPNSAAPFVFGSVNSSNPSAFSFGGAASTPAATTSAPSAAPSPFGFTTTTSASGFGSVQTPAFGSSQPTVPTFGSAASSFTATASAAPTFGAKPSTPSMFGQQPNATPAFGSSTASSGQGGFQFGGAFGATGSNNSNVFTFGGGSGATASPAATPAMSAQPVAPGGGFGFSQPPAFNIGSVKSSTPTPTGQHSIAGRKIKTAVRRRK